MSHDRLIDWEAAVFENAFGDALHECDRSFLKPGEVIQLHRLMRYGWIREAIVIYIAARWLPLHFSEPFFPELIRCVLSMVDQEPALVSNRSTQLVTAIAETLTRTAWHIRRHQIALSKN